MKRLLTTILAINTLALTAVASGIPAKTGSATQGTEEKDYLVYPSTYEQYLPLTAPSDVAVSQNFTAIADGNCVYLYDRRNSSYHCYSHTNGSDPLLNRISEMQFTANGDLYFLDGSTHLWVISKDGLETGNFTPTKTDFSCNAFSIFSNTLYYTLITPSVKSIVCASLNDSSSGTTIVDDLDVEPTITQDAGALYYTRYGNQLYKYSENLAEDTLIYTFTSDVFSMTVSGNVFCCADEQGVFSVYDLTSLLNSGKNETVQPVFQEDGSEYRSVYSENGYVYAVSEQSVKQFSIQQNKFTDYEIGSSSSSVNRLFKGVDTVIHGDLLLTLDTADSTKRISVYNVKEQTHRVFPITLQKATQICTDGKTALISCTTGAELYDLEKGTLIRSFNGFDGDVVGVAAVYGKYYFATHRGYYYTAFEQNGEWTVSSGTVKSLSTPKLLSSDAYGNIYVAYTDNAVYRFTESEFIDATKSGEQLVGVLPANTKKFAVDYEQNLYALYEKTLQKISADGSTEEIPLSKSLVYSQDADTLVTSFAFSIEENKTYIIYDGNFAVCTPDLRLPTVNTITVSDADEEIFSENSATFEIVKTKENALIVHFNIDELSGKDYFPYLAYERSVSEKTALKIGETSEYNILAELNPTTKKYSTFIVKKTACESLAQEDYLITYDEQDRTVGYLTNKVNLYKYPYLNKMLKVTTATKNAKVTLLGEIVGLDYDYYCVEYKISDTESAVGYVPKAYVSDEDHTPPTASEITIGEFDADKDSTRRLLFLLLGTAAICILFDLLIIRLKKD